ncbi:MAG: DNA gyrase subunit A [Planctomycetia bacterium]|nr:DNA gyrase subunit A [Planctomycetia bacterium]
MTRLDIPENIDDLLIEEEMKNSYMTYAMSVIVSRALPDVRDGLKPSQRRILVAMNDLNLGPRSRFRKCAKIAGDTSGNYHPHGEGVVYPTLVRMGQDFNMRYRLVDGQGNFGSIDGDPPAAMRYTEARLTSISAQMLADLERETVDFMPNYDDTTTEPTVLPAKFPNLLCNGATGIAVGMATSMPPHNLTEICNALIKVIDHPDVTIDELIKIVKGPDFPTGGFICGRQGIQQAYRTGRANIAMRAKAHIEEVRGGRSNIVVTEIPYAVLKTRIIDRIVDGVKSGTITGISDIRDESDRDGMRLVIELKRGEDETVVLNQLFRHSPMQATFSIINIALVKGRPQTLNLKQLLEAYRDHRIEVIRRRTLYLLKAARHREHILIGLLYAVANIDEVIDIIKKSPDVATARERLMKKAWRFTIRSLPAKSESAGANKLLGEATRKPARLTQVQTDAILAMQLQRLTGLEVEKLRDEWFRFKQLIVEYEGILQDEKMVLNIIAEDIYELKEKYGDARRTEIIGAVDQFEIEDLIAEENVVVTISHEGYIKRMPLASYRRQGRGGQGIIGSDTKEADFLEHIFTPSTHDYILFFTSMGQCLWLKVYDIPQLSRLSKGRALVNMLKLRQGETVASFIPVREFDENRQLVMVTAAGVVKKTSLSAYSRPKKNGIIAIRLEAKDRLIGVALTRGNDELVIGTRDGMAIRFSEHQVRSMGRATRGVRGIRLRKGDEVIGMTLVDENATLLTVCEKGYGKRTQFSAYRRQSRGGIGIINMKTPPRNGKVVAMLTVRDGDELMMISRSGQIQRIGVDSKSIRPIGRATQGVVIMRPKVAGDLLSAVARVAQSEEETTEEDGSKGKPGPAETDKAAKPAKSAEADKTRKTERPKRT